MTDPAGTAAPAWQHLRQEYLADLIEQSLRAEHEFLRDTLVSPRTKAARIVFWRRKPRIPEGLFGYFADQAAWHVIGSTQPSRDPAAGDD